MSRRHYARWAIAAFCALSWAALLVSCGTVPPERDFSDPKAICDAINNAGGHC